MKSQRPFFDRRQAVARLLAAALAFMGPGPLEALDPSGADNGSKTTYLFNFTKFVTWPASKFSAVDAPLIIGFIGAPTLQDSIEEANPESQLELRRIVVRRVANEDDIRRCHIIFIDHSQQSRLKGILAEARRHNVLSVGESDNFVPMGGVINFIVVDGRVRFQINVDAARKAGLKLSSRLLQVGEPVNSDGKPVNSESRIFR